MVFEKFGQCEKSENRRLSPQILAAPLGIFSSDVIRGVRKRSDYDYKRRETAVGSHVSIIIAVGFDRVRIESN